MMVKAFLAGLKWCLFFLFCLISLGYPIPWSIFLGTIGGLAGGLIAGYWQILEVPKPTPKQTTQTETAIAKPFSFRHRIQKGKK